MPPKIVGNIPDFTEDASAPEGGLEEVKQPVVEEPAESVRETPELPAEQPIEPPLNDDTKDTQPEVIEPVPLTPERTPELAGLQNEVVKLRKEISELRGQKRELKQQELQRVEQQIDDLKDLHPDDIKVIDRVLRSKGYMTQEEVNKIFYETVKQEEVEKFLDKYPEYKPENDPSDTHWSSLLREMGFYRMPTNPRQIREVLERAHSAIVRVTPSGPSVAARQRVVKTASLGSGGAPKPSSINNNRFSPEQRETYRRGGWSEAEITAMEAKL